MLFDTAKIKKIWRKMNGFFWNLLNKVRIFVKERMYNILMVSV